MKSILVRRSNILYNCNSFSLLLIFVLFLLVVSTIYNEMYSKPVDAQILNNSQSSNDAVTRSANNTLDIGSNNTVQDLTLPELFERAEKSVVQVTTTSGAGEPGSFRSGIGSGFVYNDDGLIVTNYHVIAPSIRLSSELVQGEANDGVDINVAFEDGTIYQANLVGADRFSDIAVIDIPEDARNRLVPLPIGNSSELRVGQQVVAIGNPFGLSGSMTEGIVSGLGRLIPSSEEEQLPPFPDGTPLPPPQDPSNPEAPLQPPLDEMPPPNPPGSPNEELLEAQRRGSFSIPDIIQTDAPINPGNSGGPLLDLRGEVIGMNTAIFSSTGESAGVGFAIPSNTLKKVVPALISSGVYQHPWLGISGTDITPEIAEVLGLSEAKGFLVTDITSESPADKAGIRGGYKIDNINGREIALGGDIIVAIDNNTVRKIDDILSYLEREKTVGDQVQLTVLRDGNIEQTLPTILAARPGSTSVLQQSSQQGQQQQQQQEQGKPAWLGVSGTPLTPEIAQALGLTPDTRGVLVIEIVAGGPADKAGIRGGYKIDNINGREIALGGDIIVAIDNRTVTTLENILTYISNEKQAGETAQLNILRDGRSSLVNVTLGEMPQSDLQGRQDGEQQPQLEIIP
jgi:serine protease Do